MPAAIPDLREVTGRVTQSTAFEYFIITMIIANGALLGLETSGAIEDRYGYWLGIGHQVILAIFIAEAALKIYAVAPKIDRYFRDGWNVFDFTVVVISLIPAVGPLATVARTARLLRVMRLISAMQELRLIVATLVRSIPSMLHIVALMGLVVYIYAIIGHQLFAEHDPDRWGNLAVSVLTLFQVITLEEWSIIMHKVMEEQPLAWVYFISYVVLATFVVVNLFIAVVINNLDEAKQKSLRELERPHTRDELLRELRSARDALHRLEEQLERSEVPPAGTAPDPEADGEGPPR